MEKFKRIVKALTSSAFFWIFVILAKMVLFILRYERPASFQLDQHYHIFK